MNELAALLALILASAINPHQHDRPNVTAAFGFEDPRLLLQFVQPIKSVLKRCLPFQVPAHIQTDGQLYHLLVFQRPP